MKKKMLLSMIFLVIGMTMGMEACKREENEIMISSRNEAVTSVITIKGMFALHNMKAGTCLSMQMLDDEKSLDFIRANFNSITFENDMKPDYILDYTASLATGDIVVKFNENTEKMLEMRNKIEK